MFDTSSLDPTPRQLALAKRFKDCDPSGARFAKIFRETLDQLYDGARTGRYSWNALTKSEKTGLGTFLEINIREAFSDIIDDGIELDYSIDGKDIDCKFSQVKTKWMIPPENFGKDIMGLHVSDVDSVFSVGFLTVDESFLTRPNRDKKCSVNKYGRAHIYWLWDDAPLPPNLLLQMPAANRNRILSQKSKQKKVNELFRSNVGVEITRGVVATVAQQKDYMKRVRHNGGARSHLRNEGIIILGDFRFHRYIYEKLTGRKFAFTEGSFVSMYVRPALENCARSVYLDGQHWVLCEKDEVIEPAPVFKHTPTPRERAAQGANPSSIRDDLL